MPGFFNKVGSFFTYKEPKNEEHGFELLEDQNEGEEQNTLNTQQQENQNQENSTKQDETQKQGKTPIKVEEWNERKKSDNVENPCQPPDNPENLSKELCANLATIKQKFDIPKNQDLIIREFKIGRKIKAFFAYIDGMIDKNALNLAIFPQLMERDLADEIGEECPVDFLIENVLSIYSLKKSKKFTDIVIGILSGASALFVEGCDECILLDTIGYEKRSVEQPVTETVVNGPQEGFTENLRTNLTLVRKIIKNEKLVIEILPVGKMNNSKCAVAYMEGIANTNVVNEVKKRIKRIDTDIIMGSGMVEQFIEDNPFMLFPQVLTTERPDRAASFVIEGQVVIIADGTPFALAVPVTFFRLLHTSEDSFSRWPYGTFLRIIRAFGLFCATLLPGIYTAVVLFHPDAIPTELLNSIARSRETVPFPTFLEVLMMEVAFELIREGGVRVPGVIGQTLGIVGALILGQASVSAGLVSPVVVIIVSVTAIGSFVIPNYSMSLAIRMERFLFILAGGFIGLFGIYALVFALAIIACSMKSFGVPFFTPVAPRTKMSPDVIVRYPIWMQKNRPDGVNAPNRKRQGENVRNWSNEKNQSQKGGKKNS